MDDKKRSVTAAIIVDAMLAVKNNKATASLVGDDATTFYRYASQINRKGDPFMAAVKAIGKEPGMALLNTLVESGIPEHYALRKKLIEQQTRQLLEENKVQQVVVVGAGMDTLALRLHKKYPQASFIEVDHPVTQELKQKIIKQGRQSVHEEERGKIFHPGPNLAFASTDFSKSTLTDALANQPFDPSKPTLFIAEGLTMYLSQNENEALFASMREAARQAGGHVIFGAIEQKKVHTTVAQGIMANREERYKWAVAAEDMPKTLHDMGLHLTGTATYHSMQNDWRAHLDLPAKQHGSAFENYYLAEIAPMGKKFSLPTPEDMTELHINCAPDAQLQAGMRLSSAATLREMRQ